MIDLGSGCYHVRLVSNEPEATRRLIAIRLTPDEVKRVDRFAAEMSVRAGGLNVARTAAVRLLVLHGLEAFERQKE